VADLKNHPPGDAESFLWSMRIGQAVRHYRLMPLPIRRVLFESGILELALTVAILVSVAYFKKITATPNRSAPADLSLCDSRIVSLADDSSREGVTARPSNEGTSGLYVLGGSKTNCNSWGKRRKQMEKQIAPTRPMATARVSNVGLALGGESPVGLLQMVAGIRRRAGPLFVENGGTK
jgi:hypothetical protein